ncbi:MULTISPECIES: TetR/AcrR family transcriptional regulator [Amycolatopsis]|uniref:DNA-binding transcriptional regulator, AcrR family n=2 Tax=Amycolatopsis TaxID=1813 RepID=A0A1I3JTV4_9PSEU|nr:TetR/AcrR family transcriptional regulator [Amycolatopsis sacchari]SFI63438.1 DNA-binding transcriptional regulator, AcrR family [Amycolatopsis sacchari]
MSSEEGNRTSRGRRGARPSGDDRELAILATAERLLAERPLRDISIDDLARGAGISRPTFYFYFRGKEAVLLALLDRVVEEADEASQRVLAQPADDTAQRWRGCINAFYETFRAHRAVALAVGEARATLPEVRELWSKVMDRWVESTAAAIETERERGAAPPGRSARDLATVLNLMNERVLHATFAAEEPTVAETGVVDVLLEVWLRAIYA